MKTHLFFFHRLAPAFVAVLLLTPGVARAADSALYVTVSTGIEAFNTSGGAGVSVVSGLTSPSGIAFDTSNDLFYGNQNGNEIDEITVGGVSTVVSTNPQRGRQIAFSPSGTLYVNDTNGIEKVGSAGMLTKVGNNDGTYGFSLAFDAAGNIYAGSLNATDVLKFPPTGGTGTQFATGVNSPACLAFDAAGNLYIASGTSTIFRVPATGGAATVFANTGLSTPDGLAFDAAGDLYVANLGTTNNNGYIERFDANGGNATLFASGLSDPEYLAFGPAVVPEPSTWALLGLGSAGLGLTLRRRRARVSGYNSIF